MTKDSIRKVLLENGFKKFEATKFSYEFYQKHTGKTIIKFSFSDYRLDVKINSIEDFTKEQKLGLSYRLITGFNFMDPTNGIGVGIGKNGGVWFRLY